MNIPHDTDAENAFLGAVLIDSTVLDNVSLSPEDFYKRDNRLIYESMLRLHENNVLVDVVAVVSDMKAAQTLHDAGGVAKITSLNNYSPTAINAAHNADIVADCARRRRVIQIARETADKACTADDISDTVAEAESRLSDVEREGKRDIYLPIDIASNVRKWVSERTTKTTGVFTGVPMLDRLTHGFQPSDLIFLAARPAMGKTALAINWALHAIQGGKCVAVFSLEMSMQQIVSRMIAIETGIDAEKIMNPAELSPEEYGAVNDCLSFLGQNYRLYIDDTAGINVSEISAKARLLKRSAGLDIIVIDYLQLIESPRRTENRVQEVSAITRGLKKLAKELNVPIVCLSQLSRSVEQRADKHPMLSDLRESGSIEQDADIVLFLYRDEYYDKTTDKKYSELTIAKHRNGQLGTVKLMFAKSVLRFSELDVITPEDFGTPVKKSRTLIEVIL